MNDIGYDDVAIIRSEKSRTLKAVAWILNIFSPRLKCLPNSPPTHTWSNKHHIEVRLGSSPW